MKPLLIVTTGPNRLGKTSLAIEIAQTLYCDICLEDYCCDGIRASDDKQPTVIEGVEEPGKRNDGNGQAAAA